MAVPVSNNVNPLLSSSLLRLMGLAASDILCQTLPDPSASGMNVQLSLVCRGLRHLQRPVLDPILAHLHKQQLLVSRIGTIQ